jgi:hypothetical protein
MAFLSRSWCGARGAVGYLFLAALLLAGPYRATAQPAVVTPQDPPVAVLTPVATDTPTTPAASFAGNWTIVTERGDSFTLDMTQTGNSAVGSVMFNGKPLQMYGSVVGADKVSLVWRYEQFAGTGEFSLGDDGQAFTGKLVMGDGTPIQGGTWKATRQGTGPALPLGEMKDGAPPDETAATTPGEGYDRAVANTGVSIRNMPGSKSSKVVGSLKGGEVVAVRCPEENRNWCQLEDGRGWVYRQYLNIGADATAAPPPPASQSASKSVTRTTPSTKQGGNGFLRRILGN